MPTKKTARTSRKSKTIGQEEVLFISNVKIPKQPGMYEQKGTSKQLTRKVEEIKEDLSGMMRQLDFIIGEADQRVLNEGFALDEITVSLGFSATGKIAFIAEAGVEASIEVTFKRK